MLIMEEQIVVEHQSNLKKRILDEMTVDYSSNLEKSFEVAKQFVRIGRDGKVEVLVKDKVSVTELIQLYLVGKLYAKEAGLTPSDEVGNKELLEQLGIPEGSLLPGLKNLRDKNKVKQTSHEKNVFHRVPVNLLESTLQSIEKKVHRKS